jgi:hypothetical protein
MGKGSHRRPGANDKLFKAAPWPPESPTLRRKETGGLTEPRSGDIVPEHTHSLMEQIDDGSNE